MNVIDNVISYAGHAGDTEAFEAEYRNILDKYGFVHAVDLPDSFDHASFLARFGAFYPGPSGKLIDDIVPETGMDDVYYGSNKRSLLPHTEGYEFPGLPPRYLALWCVTPPTGAGGETTLFDARPVTDRMSAAARSHLEESRFDWVASEGLRRIGLGQRATHPMLETVEGIELLRFSCNNLVLKQPDEVVASFRAQIMREWDGGHHRVSYVRNDLVQFDNWRVLHSRNAFSDPKRHLKRIQIRHRTDLRSCPAPAQG
ncbi:Taurine dioxygenase, alpha-ketoglutarate-dependent [Actinokineospora alba]|uniref:Taurine dioxygenase, alpha-ketoglutarate-dependent n=1 Tax=Actinokineospora alba TaxID=504798 RepID=A0A1H0JXF3_9PSEU|nr:TauD/TfdA family dioxygenase [Actinokineospora alba]TDP68125.1 alpha-ketoglutarate-dependent taurine dioxygenase [Actinokineospora alba]SDH92786.1 Taurine dioxygenase, alpha-ketoglutarate-dependent [Actinokineospora alba]SDO48327.1 Taurine dioxygenase, alpha-ketoglutarate-dependent [Actinokineospora alba]